MTPGCYAVRRVVIPIRVLFRNCVCSYGMGRVSLMSLISVEMGLFPNSPSLLWKEDIGEDHKDIMKSQIIGLG